MFSIKYIKNRFNCRMKVKRNVQILNFNFRETYTLIVVLRNATIIKRILTSLKCTNGDISQA